MNAPHNHQSIAYCPIKLPKLIIDEKVLNDLITVHDTGHHDGLWKCIPLIGRVETQHDFAVASAFESAWEKRYDPSGTIYRNEAVTAPLCALFEHMENLPLKITHAQVLSQVGYVGKHFDMKHDGSTFHDDYPDVNIHNEPAGYKILLNQFTKKSFFVSEGFGKSHHHIELPHDTNTFVINEKTFPHGADMIDEPKYIVSIFGLIDHNRHHALVEKSLSTYHDYVISFP